MTFRKWKHQYLAILNIIVEKMRAMHTKQYFKNL